MPHFLCGNLCHFVKVIFALSASECELRSLTRLDALVTKDGTDFEGVFLAFILLLVLKDRSGHNAEQFIQFSVLHAHRVYQGNVGN